ncbi:hypothetical protein, partial [Aquimarina sp. AU119]|uniref:hypothetical protein n=1 Tax=Aquimarina sp. AU119 TaxID=2108528 RepID=UPI001F25FC5D
MQKEKVSNQCAEKSKSKVTICPATTHISNVGVNLKMRNFTIYILLIFTILSCKQKDVDGIEIGHTLYTNQ